MLSDVAAVSGGVEGQPGDRQRNEMTPPQAGGTVAVSGTHQLLRLKYALKAKDILKDFIK